MHHNENEVQEKRTTLISASTQAMRRWQKIKVGS